MRLRTIIANPASIEMITVGPSGWYLNEFGSNSLNEMVVIIPQTTPNIKPSSVGFNPSPTINQASMAPNGSARADVNVQRKAFHRFFVAKKTGVATAIPSGMLCMQYQLPVKPQLVGQRQH